MLGQSGCSRAMLPIVRDIERRLRSLEQQLELVGDRTPGSTAEIAERVGATIAPVLSSIADRFRGAHSMGDEAAKLGNDVLRRLSNEIEHRPLVTLAVAVGVGILVGLASRSAAGVPRTDESGGKARRCVRHHDDRTIAGPPEGAALV
jgi:ElaB/YqjD/DUF883 family membrane-anchored ribosome-binding protein